MQRQCCGMKLEVEERRDGATARERHRDTERERVRERRERKRASRDARWRLVGWSV